MDSDELMTRSHSSPRTLQAYAFAWSYFSDWCKRAELQPLPCVGNTVRLYVTWMTRRKKRKVATAMHHISAIRYYHRTRGFEAPPTADAVAALNAVRLERRERPEGKASLEPDDLLRAVRACPLDSTTGLRDRAILVLGFATTLRRSELSRLQLSDLKFVPEGIVVRLRYSKTDQAGEGEDIPVWPGEREETDPVKTVKSWLAKRGDWDGALFCSLTRGGFLRMKPVTGETIHERVQLAIERAGIDSSCRYGSHSLRAGAVTASSRIGRTTQEIKGMSRHESTQVMEGYIRGERLFAGRNPLEGVL